MAEALSAPWRPREAWDGLAVAAPAAAARLGLRIEAVQASLVVDLLARSDPDGSGLESLALEQFGCGLPAAGRFNVGRGVTLVWSGPGQWLIVGTDPGSRIAGAAAFQGLAALVDQGDARALLRVSGPPARDVLARGFAIDLDPRSFREGDTAITKVAHIGVQIWQESPAPTYLIAVPRSSVASFWSWLDGASRSIGSAV